jgi:RND family efflux transporter MFP subunit
MNTKLFWSEYSQQIILSFIAFSIGIGVSYSLSFVYGIYQQKKQVQKLQEEVNEEEKKVAVTYFPLKKQTIEQIFSLQGHLLPSKEVTLVPEAELTVKKIYVKWGQKVKKGDLLFQVNSKAKMIKNQLNDIEHELQTSDFQAMSKLVKKEIISESEFKQKKLEFESQILKRELQKEEGSSGDILSPIDGVVSEIRMKEGDYIDRVDKYFMKVVDQSSLRFQNYLPQNLIEKVTIGQRVDIQYDEQDGKLQHEIGIIDGISPVVDAQTGTAFISITIPKIREQWKPGLYVKANFILNRREQVQALKNSSILYDKSKAYTYKVVEENGSLYSKKIDLVLGLANDEYTEIKKADLNEQDKIVDQGITMISDQSSLEIFHP